MKKPRILYFFDPLCGWCYGFSPVIEKLQKHFHEDLEFDVISGGMIVGERVGPIGEVAGYIKQAYKQVESMTGVRFGEKFLNNILEEGTAIFDSEPPSRVLTILKQHDPDRSVHFAGMIQKAIYKDGIAPTLPHVYLPYVEKEGMDPQNFLTLMNDSAIAKKTQDEFRYSGQLGISGYPTMVLQLDQEYHLIARGWRSFEDLKPVMERILSTT